ncbi:hypothetical protein [Burkholderia metallica]|uniref:hypothetical protein n=1 Tax=Burkholderia metallica TaxID=488729 RepID=UPI00131D28BB|nr:hypothetical protein [Burkholderia metallica]
MYDTAPWGKPDVRGRFILFSLRMPGVYVAIEIRQLILESAARAVESRAEAVELMCPCDARMDGVRWRDGARRTRRAAQTARRAMCRYPAFGFAS